MNNNILNTCEKTVFYLFVFLVPFQVGKFIFSFGSLKYLFYNQLFIYLSDILIVALICFWLIRIIKNKQRDIFFLNIKKDLFLVLFIIISGLSIFFAINKILATVHFIKLLEFSLLYFYIKNNFNIFDRRHFFYVLLSSAMLQVGIASLQFYFQESLGIRHIGESVISPIMQNVAKINESGYKLLRGYGTFPHPNILAAFFSFASFLPYFFYFNNKAMPTGRQAGIRQESAISQMSYYEKIRQTVNSPFLILRRRYLVKNLFFILALSMLIIGLFLTFSRAAIVSFVAVICAMLFVLAFKKKTELKKICKAFVLTLILFLFCFLIFNKEILARINEVNSFEQRVFYADIFKNAVLHSPIFGIGIGNFVEYFHNNYPNLPEWQYQPVHNLYLIVFAEIGVLGGLLFTLFLGYNIYRFFKNRDQDLFGYVILAATIHFLIIANFDHYFWTLQQGQIMFWITIGILGASRLSDNKNNILSST